VKYLLALVMAAVVACSMSNLPATKTPLAQARAVASLTGDVWIMAAQACREAAVTADDQNLLDKCRNILEPARASILAVDAAIDAAQTPDLCGLRKVLDAAQSVLNLTGVLKAAPGTATTMLNDALSLVPACSASDAGAE
jgi:hypothetical protein